MSTDEASAYDEYLKPVSRCRQRLPCPTTNLSLCHFDYLCVANMIG